MQQLKAALSGVTAKVVIVPTAIAYGFWARIFPGFVFDLETNIHTVHRFVYDVADGLAVAYVLLFGAPYFIDRPWPLRAAAVAFYSCTGAVPFLYFYFYVVEGVYRHKYDPFVGNTPLILGVAVTLLYLVALLSPPGTRSPGPSGPRTGGSVAGGRLAAGRDALPATAGGRGPEGMPLPQDVAASRAGPGGRLSPVRVFTTMLSSPAAKILVVPVALLYAFWTEGMPTMFTFQQTNIHAVRQAIERADAVELVAFSQYLLMGAPYLIGQHWILRTPAVPIYLFGTAAPILYLYFFVADGVGRATGLSLWFHWFMFLGLGTTFLYVVALLVPSPRPSAAAEGRDA